MKITVRKADGKYSIYVPKKDLEAFIVEFEEVDGWGGQITLDNDWILELPVLPEEPKLPTTIDAKVISKD